MLLRILVSALYFSVSVAGAQEMAPVLHNGSLMLITQDQGNVEIRYENPRAGLSVTQGAVLFTGTRDAKGAYAGTAYTFKKNCAPAPYAVTGKVSDRGLVLAGLAPRRDTNSCDLSRATVSPSTLVFEYEPG